VTALVQREFKSWARDTVVALGGQDEANNLLYVAALTASHLGDHPAWRYLSGLLGCDTLLRLDRHAAAGYAGGGLRSCRSLARPTV
jgi:hypothetical protein